MHGNLSTRLEKLFTQAIQAAFGELVPAEIAQSAEEKFGHYQCNSALKLSKQLRRKSARCRRKNCFPRR